MWGLNGEAEWAMYGIHPSVMRTNHCAHRFIRTGNLGRVTHSTVIASEDKRV